MTTKNRLFAVMATSFVLLGMPIAAMGVAWPSAAEDLGRTIGELGLVTFSYGAGYTVSTLVSGELTRRFTTGPLLVVAAFAAAGSLVVLTLTSIWAPFLGAMFLLGVAGGLLDSGVNAYVAVHRGARSMGIIHTGFGLGSAIGPLFVTVLLAAGLSWRIAFASLATADLLLAVAFVTTVGALDRTNRRSGDRPTVDGKGVILGLSVTVFFLYAGVAAGTGAWAFSLLTEGRGISTGIAGLAVAGYWGAMTVSRLALGILGDRIDPRRALTVSGTATVASLLVLWIASPPWLGLVALIFSGFAHGSVFPLEMLLTARRFGATYTPWAVGYEIAGANIGVAVVSGGIGLLVSRWDIAVVAPVLFLVSVMLLAAIEALRFRSAAQPIASI
ncbi:MAG: MFS transporter [Actinomycetia bacterium]|nr:MFS transporter [Actinomycetes bacterium]